MEDCRAERAAVVGTECTHFRRELTWTIEASTVVRICDYAFGVPMGRSRKICGPLSLNHPLAVPNSTPLFRASP